MKKKFFCVLLVLLLGFSYGSLSALAANTKSTSAAKLTADQVNYLDENRQIEATGHVLITYDNTVIKADYAVIDQELNSLLAKGNVQLIKDGSVYKGDRLYYYLTTRQGWLSPSKFEIKDENIHGELRLTADEAVLKGDEILIKKSWATTCDLAKPHYHFTAEQADYYPDDRVVLHHVWYYEGSRRLMYFPKLCIFLNGQESGFELPEIGYSDDTGWYLGLGYHYYVNKRHYGRIYLDDLTQWGGNGFGVTHYLQLTDTSHWYGDVFLKENSNMGYPEDDYRLTLGYKNWQNPNLNYETSFVHYQQYSKTGESELEQTYSLYVNGINSWPYFKAYFHEEELYTTNPFTNVKTDDKNRDYKLYESWNYQLGKTWSLNSTANWNLTGFKSVEASEQFYYSLSLIKNWENSNLMLYLNDTRVLSGDYSATNYMPELTYTVNKCDIPLLKTIEATYQYTNMEKVVVVGGTPDNDQTSAGVRWAFDLTKTNNLWKSDQDKFLVNLEHRFRYRHFDVTSLDKTATRAEDSTPDGKSEIKAFTETLNMRYNFNENLSTTFGVGYTERQGPTDDFFEKSDDFPKGGLLSNSWNWESKHFSAELSGGYSLYTNKYEEIDLSTDWNWENKHTVGISTSYDVDEGFQTSQFSVQYNPNDDWKLNIGLGYDHQASAWTEKIFQAVMKPKITSKLSLEITSVYDLFRDDFTVGNVGLDYDWHCRDLKCYYDYIEKEFWVLISIKAFPQAGFKLSNNLDDLYDWYLK